MGYKVAARMSTTLPDRATLREACTGFARAAAREIMRIYAGDLGERAKADNSPVTDADHAAEAIIVAGLRKLTPDRPVVAEEEMAAGRVPMLDGGPFWLVDPLDGTKEFIKRNGEFTVNIALIERGGPGRARGGGRRGRHHRRSSPPLRQTGLRQSALHRPQQGREMIPLGARHSSGAHDHDAPLEWRAPSP